MALGLMLAAAVLQSGCVVVAAGAGAGAVAYIRGDLESTLSANLERSGRATLAAIEQLKFAQISDRKDSMLVIYVARNAADKKIELRLESAGDQLTKIKIRVGFFGDEKLSLAILEKVKANL
jgi:hypothetical protein